MCLWSLLKSDTGYCFKCIIVIRQTHTYTFMYKRSKMITTSENHVQTNTQPIGKYGLLHFTCIKSICVMFVLVSVSNVQFNWEFDTAMTNELLWEPVWFRVWARILWHSLWITMKTIRYTWYRSADNLVVLKIQFLRYVCVLNTEMKLKGPHKQATITTMTMILLLLLFVHSRRRSMDS